MFISDRPTEKMEVSKKKLGYPQSSSIFMGFSVKSTIHLIILGYPYFQETSQLDPNSSTVTRFGPFFASDFDQSFCLENRFQLHQSRFV
jgi:hypothetical protein